MENTEIRDTREIMRDQMRYSDRIIALLRDGPKTIPQIAEGLDRPGNEVVCWVMGMWRCGALAPVGKPDADGYYQYRFIQKDPQSTDPARANHG